MGYASPDDMISRFDVRTLGDLCGDASTRITATLLETNPKMIAALDSAAGKINAACLQGERYSVDDLAGLKGDSKAFLVDINCVVAWGNLWRRKGYTEDNMVRANAIQDANDELRRLRTGEHVFDVLEQKQAGRADVSTVPRETIGRDWNLVNDRMRGHIYPRRRSFRDI